MKKMFLFLLAVAMCYATNGDFEKNLSNTIKNSYKNIKEIKIISKDKLKSIKDLNLIIFNVNNSSQSLAIFSSNDGKTILSLPQNMIFSNKDDENLVGKKISDIEQEKRKFQEKVAYELLKTMPKDRFIEIESFDKNNKFTMYMVSDPECPHCIAEISKLSKWLRNTHLKIIFAPVHGESARTKAAVMLREASKIKSNDQKTMIKMLEKYYDKNLVLDKSKATEEERDLVLQDAKKIFSKGVIKGVPFTFVVEE